MTDPIKLTGLDAEPVSPTLVSYIRGVLDMAERGELSSVAMAYVFRDGSSGRGWSSNPKPTALIGAVSILHHKMLDGA